MCKKIQGQNEEHVVDQKKKQEHVGRNENLSKKKKRHQQKMVEHISINQTTNKNIDKTKTTIKN